MNIFMIICDELRADALENEVVKTPNIDAFTKDSVLFNQSYCNTPMCVPSRLSIVTGRHALSHGAIDNILTPFEDEKSLYSMLKENNYQTSNHGKWHVNIAPNLFGMDYDYSGLQDTQAPEKYISCFGISDKATRAKTEFKKNDGDISLIISGKRPSHKDQTLDSVVTDSYLKYIEDIDKSKPIFARLSIMDPHTPYIPAEPYASMYDPSRLELPASLNDSLVSKPALQRYFHKVRGFDRLQETDYRKTKAAYYGAVSHVDERIGKVFQKLKELDLYDDSLIIFTSDHGTMLGEHGFVEKWGHLYDQVMKTPLMIKFPESKHKGKKLQSFVESIDILPTVLELLDIHKNENIQGISLLPYIEGQTDKHKDEVYAQYFCGSLQDKPALMIRDNKWKLTSYPDGNSLEDKLFEDHPLRGSKFFDVEDVLGELYDLSVDPDERVNLFNDLRYQNIKNVYLEKLTHWEKGLDVKIKMEIDNGTNDLGTYSFIQGKNTLKARALFKGKNKIHSILDK